MLANTEMLTCTKWGILVNPVKIPIIEPIKADNIIIRGILIKGK